MDGKKIMENKFVMNEYLEVHVNKELLQLCSDCYPTLGWKIFNTSTGINSVTLKLRRNRKIKNRAELCDFQRRCEDAFIAIEKLENSKMMKPMAISLGVGILGTVFMAGSVFAYLEFKIQLSTILAITAIIGWWLPYLLYKKYLKESTEKIRPMIDKNYDQIYEVCEKASKLLD